MQPCDVMMMSSIEDDVSVLEHTIMFYDIMKYNSYYIIYIQHETAFTGYYFAMTVVKDDERAGYVSV